jgi:hypothetical protein
MLNNLIDLSCTIIRLVMEHLKLFCAEQTNEQTAGASTELCQYVEVEGSYIHAKALFGFTLL